MDVVTGDDVAIVATLKVVDATGTETLLDMSTALGVDANLVTKDHTSKFMATDTVQNLLHPSNDLANGKIVIEFPSATTAAITEYGTALLEVEVTDSGGNERTWFLSGIKIIQGQVA
jgi:hypothetical protein